MDQEKDKRVFLGVDIQAPWPAHFPDGMVIREENRHLTLAFLGTVQKEVLEKLKTFLKPNFCIGPVGEFTKLVFLPRSHPNVVAYEVKWLGKDGLQEYRSRMVRWLQENDISSSDFYPHVTISRGQFDPKEWEKSFSSFPFYVGGVHLYESLNHSEYKKLASHSLIPPFEEIHHTADIAYLVRGTSLEQVHRNAEVALAFSFPPILSFIERKRVCNSVEEIVIDLNEHVAKADAEYGCSFKAVSFHGKLQQTKEGMLQWEMIIDV